MFWCIFPEHNEKLNKNYFQNIVLEIKSTLTTKNTLYVRYIGIDKG